MTRENDIYALRYDAEQRLKTAQAAYDLADAWIGLDSLLKGGWGRENVDALGGGKTQIEKAYRVLGGLLQPEVAGRA